MAWVLPVPALASSTVVPVGSGPQTSKARWGRTVTASPAVRVPAAGTTAGRRARRTGPARRRQVSSGGVAVSRVVERRPPSPDLQRGRRRRPHPGSLPVAHFSWPGTRHRRRRHRANRWVGVFGGALDRHRQRLAQALVVQLDQLLQHRRCACRRDSGVQRRALRPATLDRDRQSLRPRRVGIGGGQGDNAIQACSRAAGAELAVGDRDQAVSCRPPTVPRNCRPSGQLDDDVDRPARRGPQRRGPVDQRPEVVEDVFQGADAERTGRQHPAPPFGLPAVRLRGPRRAGRAATGRRRPTSAGVQFDGQRIGRVVLLEPDSDVQPLPQEALGRVGQQRDQRPPGRCPAAAAAGSGDGRNSGTGCRGPAAARAPPSAAGSKVNGAGPAERRRA